jgi:shikimate dehydrogenase
VAGPALVLGAGGVARSAVWALADLGARSITVLNRTPPRAEEVVHQFGPQLPNVRLQWGPLEAVAEPAPAPYAVVINATSMGHDGAAPAVHPSCYSRDSLAIELAYNPPETAFMVAAQAAGARAENGLGMLVHQAALAFEYWTGQPAPMHAYQTAVGGAVSP